MAASSGYWTRPSRMGVWGPCSPAVRMLQVCRAQVQARAALMTAASAPQGKLQMQMLRAAVSRLGMPYFRVACVVSCTRLQTFCSSPPEVCPRTAFSSYEEGDSRHMPTFSLCDSIETTCFPLSLSFPWISTSAAVSVEPPCNLLIAVCVAINSTWTELAGTCWEDTTVKSVLYQPPCTVHTLKTWYSNCSSEASTACR